MCALVEARLLLLDITGSLKYLRFTVCAQMLRCVKRGEVIAQGWKSVRNEDKGSSLIQKFKVQKTSLTACE